MKLNNILQMIEQTDVEWKALGEIAEIGTGSSNRQDESENGIYPFYVRSKNILKAIHFEFDEIAIILPGEGGIGDIFHYVEGKYALHQRAYRICVKSEKLNPKFLYYFMSHYFKNYILSRSVGATATSIRKPMLEKFQIPIPPLYLQKEIVKVLDKLTELKATLKATLKAELSLREKQYHYYRDHLLTFGDEVEWKTLKDVALDFGRGKSKHRPRNDVRLYGGDIPFIQTGDIRNSSHLIEDYSQTYSDFGLQQSKLWGKGTLCITIAANIAETGILNFDACFPDSIIGFVADPNQTNEHYVEYLLSSFKTKLQSQSTGSAQENINLSTFDNLLLPFPPLESQQKIVAILDKFERLTHSITEGLPKEIELREKQYIYYREKLLNFPKP